MNSEVDLTKQCYQIWQKIAKVAKKCYQKWQKVAKVAKKCQSGEKGFHGFPRGSKEMLCVRSTRAWAPLPEAARCRRLAILSKNILKSFATFHPTYQCIL